ncbi:MAG: hypothetical protein LBO67_09435 [Spirochaetaceae bacterium]|nr:hypothetical protein [Spirochaetaceae bacterium]
MRGLTGLQAEMALAQYAQGEKKMQRRLILCAVAVVHITFSAPVGADMTKKELQDMYCAYLNAEGYSAALDQEGDIRFVYPVEGRKFYFYIIIYADDQRCFQIAAVNFWEINSEEEWRKALIAASTVSCNTWVVKVSVDTAQKTVNFSAEMLLVKPEDFTQVFDTMLSFMAESMLDFAAQMGERIP